MQIKEGISVGKSSESMMTKGICVLVVNEDSTCNNIVSEMLHHCNYEVLHIGDASDVLNAIWETKDGLELILTNVHKLETNGIQIVRNIQKQLNLEIILMSPDTTKIPLKNQPFSFAAYVLNGLSRNGVNNLWQFALRKEKANNERDNVLINAVEKKTKTTSISETKDFYDKCKKNDAPNTEDVNEDQKPKKTRVNWTGEMHQKFLKAIEILGYEKAVPKKILEIMNVPGLTRENVASHLQKFRGGLKRTQEIASSYVLPTKSTPRLRSYLTRQRNNLTNLQQSPYISNTTLQSYYLKTHKDSFFRAPERKNFRIYDDHTKNVLLGVNKNIDINHFSSDKFVGYRLTDDGTSIQFGNLDNRICKDSRESAATSLNLAVDENQAQTGFSNLPQCHSMPFIFPTDQEYSLPFLETHENDFIVQDSPSFFEENSQQGSLQEAPHDLSDFLDRETIDDVPSDWGELDDTFFNHEENV